MGHQNFSNISDIHQMDSTPGLMVHSGDSPITKINLTPSSSKVILTNPAGINTVTGAATNIGIDIDSTQLTLTESQITGLVTDLGNKQTLSSNLTALSGASAPTTAGLNLLSASTLAAQKTILGISNSVGVNPTDPVTLNQATIIKVAAVNMLANGQTIIVPVNNASSTNMYFTCISAWGVLTAITGTLVTAAVITLGTNASSYNNVCSATTLTLFNTLNDRILFTLANSSTRLDISTNPIKVNVSGLGIGIGLTTYTMNVYVQGFFEAQ